LTANENNEFQAGAADMAIKLLMTWDILPGHEQEYFEFVVRDFIPGVQRMGMEPSDAWFTMYGNKPQILAVVQMPSFNELKGILGSSDWKDLTQRLLEYVENFNLKVVQARSGFQM
jgi:hypothetical protein